MTKSIYSILCAFILGWSLCIRHICSVRVTGCLMSAGHSLASHLKKSSLSFSKPRLSQCIFKEDGWKTNNLPMTLSNSKKSNTTLLIRVKGDIYFVNFSKHNPKCNQNLVSLKFFLFCYLKKTKKTTKKHFLFFKAQRVLGIRFVLLLCKNFRGSNLFLEIREAKQMTSDFNCMQVLKISLLALPC